MDNNYVKQQKKRTHKQWFLLPQQGKKKGRWTVNMDTLSLKSWRKMQTAGGWHDISSRWAANETAGTVSSGRETQAVKMLGVMKTFPMSNATSGEF